ncbi:MAG: hypothetical protein ACOCQR_02520 [bacterium]
MVWRMYVAIGEARDLGFRITDDIYLREKVVRKLFEEDGFCPGKKGIIAKHRCVCNHLKEKGECNCGLFVKRKD